jgi:hypothetical protein
LTWLGESDSEVEALRAVDGNGYLIVSDDGGSF